MEIAELTRKAGGLEILRALREGPKTFSELAKLINVHTLQRRLDEFIKSGLILRKVLPDRRVEYSLTYQGLELATKLMIIDRTLTGNLKNLMGEWYEGFIQEWEAYWSMRDKLLENYEGRYIAICEGKLSVVSDSFYDAVIKAQEKCGLRPIYVVKVGEELTPYIIRSPKVKGHEATR
ncbi:MAG: winged helix-turn-helix transcriptional regulator [Nitrososphaerales archaeon]